MPNRRHREFTAIEPNDDGPTFTLAGELFHCLPLIPAGVFRDLPDALNDLDGLYDFVRAVLVEDDRDRFDEVTHRVDLIVPAISISEIARWLIDIEGGGLSPFAPVPVSTSSNGHATTRSTSAPPNSRRGSAPGRSTSATS